jgi:hypothetical protein
VFAQGPISATFFSAEEAPWYPIAYLRLEAGVQFVRIPQQDPVYESPNQVRGPLQNPSFSPAG